MPTSLPRWMSPASGTVNIGLLDGCGESAGALAGQWVLIHVGFALSKIDEQEALATLELLEEMGAAYEEELHELSAPRRNYSRD